MYVIPVSKIITFGEDDFCGNKKIGPQMLIDVCIFVGERSKLEIFDVVVFKHLKQLWMKIIASMLMMKRCNCTNSLYRKVK